MAPLDLKKDLKHLYAPTKTFAIVDVPAMSFLMIDGRGDPRDESYKQVVATLFGVAYAIKFHVKKTQGIDFGVMPLEGRWWVEENTDLDFESRDNWMWTLMIMQPDVVTTEIVEQCRAAVRKKKELATLPPVRLERFTEGLVGQVLYTGPFADEMPTIEKLHDFIMAQGGMLTGKHHEIYLSDFNRTAPEKLRTILRQPLKMSINEPA